MSQNQSQPFIFINFKIYPAGLGEKQRELLDFLESLTPLSFGSATNYRPASPTGGLQTTNFFHLIVPPTEIAPIWENYNFPLWGQHCDPIENPRATGWISATMLKEAGAIGAMLNHSEHPLPIGVVAKTIDVCRENGLKTLVCCRSVAEGRAIATLNPDFLAYEPPELIASRADSVTSKKKEIEELVSFLKSRASLTPPASFDATSSSTSPISSFSYPFLLIGAGIRTHADILESEKLGASGVLLSSAVMEGGKEEIKKLLAV